MVLASCHQHPLRNLIIGPPHTVILPCHTILEVMRYYNSDCKLSLLRWCSFLPFLRGYMKMSSTLFRNRDERNSYNYSITTKALKQNTMGLYSWNWARVCVIFPSFWYSAYIFLRFFSSFFSCPHQHSLSLGCLLFRHILILHLLISFSRLYTFPSSLYLIFCYLIHHRHP